MGRYLERLLIDSQGNQLAGLPGHSRCHNDALLPADRIGHGDSRLALAKVDLRHDLPGALVMRSE